MENRAKERTDFGDWLRTVCSTFGYNPAHENFQEMAKSYYAALGRYDKRHRDKAFEGLRTDWEPHFSQKIPPPATFKLVITQIIKTEQSRQNQYENQKDSKKTEYEQMHKQRCDGLMLSNIALDKKMESGIPHSSKDGSGFPIVSHICDCETLASALQRGINNTLLNWIDTRKPRGENEKYLGKSLDELNAKIS